MPTRTWHGGHRYSPYGYHYSSRHSPSAVPQSFTATGNYHGNQHSYDYNAYNGTTQGTVWSRNQNGSTYGYNCEDDSPIQLSSGPSYILPSADPVNSISYLTTPASPRGWGPASHVNKGQHNGFYSENLLSTSTAPIGAQFLSYNHGQSSLTGEPVFPGNMTPITNLVTSDRLLPHPAATASRSLSAAKITSIETNPMHFIQSSSNGWTEPMSSSSQSSRTLSIGLSDGSDSSVRSAASSAAQDMGCGFLPISHSPHEGSLQPATIVTAAETSQPHFEYQKTALGDYRKDRIRTISREDLLSSQDEAVAEAYGYTSEHRTEPRPANYACYSSGQLSNGQAYTRIRQSSDHNISSTQEYHPESSGQQTHLPHPASIASINNVSGSGY